MTRDAAEILKDALALPVEARAALIGPLVDSQPGEKRLGGVARD
jgi:hypothetical protein